MRLPSPRLAIVVVVVPLLSRLLSLSSLASLPPHKQLLMGGAVVIGVAVPSLDSLWHSCALPPCEQMACRGGGAGCRRCHAAPHHPTHDPSHEQLLVRLGAGDVSFLHCHCRYSPPPSLWSSTGPGARQHRRFASSVIHPTSSRSQAWGQVLVPCCLLVLLMLLVVVVVPRMTHPTSKVGGGWCRSLFAVIVVTHLLCSFPSSHHLWPIWPLA